MGCCSVMLLLKLVLGTQQQQQQVLTSRSFLTRLVCHILWRSMISDFRRSCFCPQVVTNRFLLVVGGKKSLSWLVMIWLHYYYYYYHPYDIWSMCNNFWRSFGQIEPPPTSCTCKMNGLWKWDYNQTWLNVILISITNAYVMWNFFYSHTNDTLTSVKCFKVLIFFSLFCSSAKWFI